MFIAYLIVEAIVFLCSLGEACGQLSWTVALGSLKGGQWRYFRFCLIFCFMKIVFSSEMLMLPH